jgi:hypothetical protein
MIAQLGVQLTVEVTAPKQALPECHSCPHRRA